MDKYSEEPYSSNPNAGDLVKSLERYVEDNVAEQTIEASVYLYEFATNEFGTGNCESLPGVESNVCTFMKTRQNNAVFSTANILMTILPIRGSR